MIAAPCNPSFEVQELNEVSHTNAGILTVQGLIYHNSVSGVFRFLFTCQECMVDCGLPAQRTGRTDREVGADRTDRTHCADRINHAIRTESANLRALQVVIATIDVKH